MEVKYRCNGFSTAVGDLSSTVANQVTDRLSSGCDRRLPQFGVGWALRGMRREGLIYRNYNSCYPKKLQCYWWYSREGWILIKYWLTSIWKYRVCRSWLAEEQRQQSVGKTQAQLAEHQVFYLLEVIDGCRGISWQSVQDECSGSAGKPAKYQGGEIQEKLTNLNGLWQMFQNTLQTV